MTLRIQNEMHLMIKQNGRRSTEVGKIRSQRIRSTNCVSWNGQELCSIIMRYEHHRERFASKVGTRDMVPPYSVLRPSGVKTTKDIQIGETISCKFATIM